MEPKHKSSPPPRVCGVWALSTTSNVHVAKDQAWFAEYTPFPSFLSGIPSLGDVGVGAAAKQQGPLVVHGIGRVQLTVKRRKRQSGRASHSTLILRDVLHVPDAPCNILGGPLLQPDTHGHDDGGASSSEPAPAYRLDFSGAARPDEFNNDDNVPLYGGRLMEKDGPRRVAFFETHRGVLAMRLSGYPYNAHVRTGKSPLPKQRRKNPKVAVALGADWAAAERVRWHRFQAIKAAAREDDWADSDKESEDGGASFCSFEPGVLVHPLEFAKRKTDDDDDVASDLGDDDEDDDDGEGLVAKLEGLDLGVPSSASAGWTEIDIKVEKEEEGQPIITIPTIHTSAVKPVEQDVKPQKRHLPEKNGHKKAPPPKEVKKPTPEPAAGPGDLLSAARLAIDARQNEADRKILKELFRGDADEYEFVYFWADDKPAAPKARGTQGDGHGSSDDSELDNEMWESAREQWRRAGMDRKIMRRGEGRQLGFFSWPPRS